MTKQEVFKSLAPFIDYLAARWQDESEYEDINEYAEAIKKRLPEGYTFLKMKKRPFGFEFNGPDCVKGTIVCKGNKIIMTG